MIIKKILIVLILMIKLVSFTNFFLLIIVSRVVMLYEIQ